MALSSKIRKLLLSSDDENIQLGIELLINICDPEVVLPLVKPFSYVNKKIILPSAFHNRKFESHMQKAYMAVLTDYAELDESIKNFCQSIDEFTIHHLEQPRQLSALTALKKLRIYGLVAGAPLNAFKCFTKLETLEIFTAPGQQSLDFVADLPKLKHLKLVNWPTLQNLKPLQGHPALTHLSLLSCPGLKEAKVLSTIPSLQKVQAIGCPHLKLPTLSTSKH